MAITLADVKRTIGKFIKRDKPEPYLAILAEDSIEVQAVDWLKNIGAKQEKEFWIISRDQAKKAFTSTSFDWDTHWKKEEERMKQRIKEGLGGR